VVITGTIPVTTATAHKRKRSGEDITTPTTERFPEVAQAISTQNTTPRAWHGYGNRVFQLAESRHGGTAGTQQGAWITSASRRSGSKVSLRRRCYLLNAGRSAGDMPFRDFWPASCVSLSGTAAAPALQQGSHVRD
jgi:hypothetical protein